MDMDSEALGPSVKISEVHTIRLVLSLDADADAECSTLG